MRITQHEHVPSQYDLYSTEAMIEGGKRLLWTWWLLLRVFIFFTLE